MKDLTLINFNKRFPNEQACIDYLARIRWGDSPICIHCGSTHVYTVKSRPLFVCADCKRQFTVKVGTIFEDSHIPLHTWFYAVYLLTSLKKGISSIQLAKYLEITQKSAWHMLQRIRYCMEQGVSPLDGIVEIDETYIGGKAKQNVKFQKKSVVLGIVQKRKEDGQIRTKVTKQADATVALPFIRANIRNKTVIHSDESRIYHRVKYEYEHSVVMHADLEYVRAGVSTNTIDGAWDHLKLGLKAIYMGVSPKHLAKYVDEFAYRYNTRNISDGERFDRWFKSVSNKRLTYEKLIS